MKFCVCIYIYILKVIDLLLVYIQHMHDLTLFGPCAVGRKRGHAKEWTYAVCYITLFKTTCGINIEYITNSTPACPCRGACV